VTRTPVLVRLLLGTLLGVLFYAACIVSWTFGS
jgi:hypothetical protein